MLHKSFTAQWAWLTATRPPTWSCLYLTVQQTVFLRTSLTNRAVLLYGNYSLKSSFPWTGSVHCGQIYLGSGQFCTNVECPASEDLLTIYLFSFWFIEAVILLSHLLSSLSPQDEERILRCLSLSSFPPCHSWYRTTCDPKPQKIPRILIQCLSSIKYLLPIQTSALLSSCHSLNILSTPLFCVIQWPEVISILIWQNFVVLIIFRKELFYSFLF